MSRTDEFLDLYKELEQLLKQNSERYENSVARFENSREGAKFKEDLNAIREIRNLLQHQPKINGSYIVDPSEEVVSSLKEIVDYVRNPKVALDYAVKGDQIYKTDVNARLSKVSYVMATRGFSHVPVYENNRMIGVLSVQVIFEFLVKNHQISITDDIRVGDLRELLPVDKHRNEYYRFVDRNTLLYEADKLFEEKKVIHKRLVTIFITETGKQNEPLLGLLTPWSILGVEED